MVKSAHVIARYGKTHNDGGKIKRTKKPLVTELMQKLAFTVIGGKYEQQRELGSREVEVV
jgi:hypothetical protein